MTVVDQFIHWAHAELLQSCEAQEYLLGRGASSEQWKKHQIGYVSGCYHPIVGMDPGHSEACDDKKRRNMWCDSCRMMRWSTVWEEHDGGISKHIGQRIVGSIVFPLTSYSGVSVGFQTRSIREKHFDSFVVSRKPEGFFFGVAPNMTAIWSSKKVFIVEGPFDHLVFERLVSPNVIGLSTSAAGFQQTRFLTRFVDEVVLLLDMDKAGRDGAKSMRDRLKSGPTVDRLRFDIGNNHGAKCKDLNEAWKVLGDDRFRKYFTNLIGGRV